jgi:hypothetical protein
VCTSGGGAFDEILSILYCLQVRRHRLWRRTPATSQSSSRINSRTRLALLRGFEFSVRRDRGPASRDGDALRLTLAQLRDAVEFKLIESPVRYYLAALYALLLKMACPVFFSFRVLPFRADNPACFRL